MKKLLLSTFFICTIWCQIVAQVTTKPAIIQKGYAGEITIIYNPAEGNGGMKNATKCYAHTGLITSKSSSNSDWKYATEKWRGGDSKYQMTKNGSNWELTIPNINSYYGCPTSEEILKIAFVFNDGPSGSCEGKTADGGDIFVTLVDAGLNASITSSMSEISTIGTSVTLTCNATSSANLVLKLNGDTVKSANNVTQMTYMQTLSATGNYEFTLEATNSTETATATAFTCIPTTAVTATRPSGIDNGIYYNTSDSTKATLCTYAASKTEPAKNVFVVGDFNDWTISNDYQLKRDGNYFWIELSGLVPQKEYAYQFVVVRSDDKIVRIDDLYATKVLHPDDKYEPKSVDPSLMDYPTKGEGYVSVLQTGKKAFNWSEATLNFQRPNKDNLVIYELWIYDYTPARSINGLMERLDYIEKLGVNAIELMPICEFDGNYNWGYSPNHYFAPDKAYGSESDIKTFIDECHKRGIAVILDMVFNHATGLNPMNKLYPYGTDLASNPWFNTSAPHSDNVYEDWNHDFEPAKTMFKRALQYWLNEYKVDGYRMDLSHGFCGADCSTLYANLKEYNNTVKATVSDAYFIQEYWGSSPSQSQLVSEGMICWTGGSSMNNAYCQTAMGWLKDGDDISGANVGEGYISYCESHDEERCFFKAKQWGDGTMKTDLEARCNRIPLNIAFNVLLNGSHMFYQYAELGYDYSKWQNCDEAWGTNPYSIATTIDGESKTSTKPRPENRDFFASGARMNAYQKVAQLIQLRTKLAPTIFEGNPTATQLGSGKMVRSITWGSDVFAVGNFSATTTQTVQVPSGSWFDYFSGNVQTGNTTITLQPGELKIYTKTKYELPEVPSSFDFEVSVKQIEQQNSGYIYPTTVANTLYLISNDSPIRMQIYGINGSMYETTNATSTINVSSLEKGLYLLVVTYKDKQEAYKFIKK